MRFEWDPEKNRANIAKHGLSFEVATELFEIKEVVIRRSRHVGSDDEQWLITGFIEGKLATVIFTYRGKTIRIISARRARDDEKRNYGKFYSG